MIALLGTAAPPDFALARQMLAAAPHRGSCTTLRVLGNCVLGIATRPDFVDASISIDGPIIAALSGRLDNAPDLQRSLTDLGVPPASPADADVVVAAFKAFGWEAPRRMRGAFSGAVSDGRTLWCFRDHIGFRPLFYHNGPQAFVAAIEPRQVVAGGRLSEQPNLDVLELMFYERMPADAPAALLGVERLAQSHTLTIDATSSVSIRRYWDPAPLLETARLSYGDMQDRFIELLAQATARSLTGKDVVLLSGGLDSPAVAAFAAPEHLRRTGKPIGALSCVFPDIPAVDELPFIKIVAERYGITLNTYRPEARTLDNVEEWCRRLASPTPTISIPELADNHARARSLGYENLLTGDFAEFVFGSPVHMLTHLLLRGRWRSLAKLLMREVNRGAYKSQIVSELLGSFVPGRLANWYIHWRGLDAPERIPSWLDARKVNERPYRADLLPPSHRRWLETQLAGTHGATITMEADEVVGAMAGVTIRRPFADIDLWEFFLSLRAELKCPTRRFKSLGRDLLRGYVPDAIIDRRDKTVFDDHVLNQIDYPALRRLLVNPRHRLPNVDYERLGKRIEQQTFTFFDWFWAKDLAQIHAFLNAW
jgi:asparagine synthase (glutamine-hydrolysing)